MMDKNPFVTNLVQFANLSRWNALSETDDSEVPNYTPKFSISHSINKKIILWLGDIRYLDVDAVVCPTNEGMNDTSGLAGSILEGAGSELKDELSKMENCRTGECRLTRGYNLPARYIIHTVGPRYNEKYRTAAENALHSCYRGSLEMLKENKLGSIAFPIINSQRRGYPPEAGAHVAIRTVRRFLEKYGADIATVIFAMASTEDLNLYSSILPLYFPRNKREILKAKEELPRDTGDEMGQTVIEERKIRISAFPGNVTNIVESPELSKEPVKILSTKESSSLPPLGNFAFMQGDFDEERKKRLENYKVDTEKIAQQNLYYTYLKKAQTTDLSDVAKLNIIYESGKDSSGRPIVVFVANRLPSSRALLDGVFLYMLKLMDRIAEHPYVVVYIHTLMNEKDTPEFSWMKQIYNIMDAKYGDHLHSFYVLHPTFWLKIFETVISKFMENDSFFQKLKYVDSLQGLYNGLPIDQVHLPEEVKAFDLKENGPIRSEKKSSNARSFVSDL